MVVEHDLTNIVHKGIKGGKKGCGVDTTDKSEYWVNSDKPVNCDKDGCK